MKRALRSLQHHVLYGKYNGQDSEISALLGKCGYKVIPLLKEYFHDDQELLYQLLGGEDGFILREETKPPKGVKDQFEPRYLYRDRYAEDGQYDEEAYAALME